MGCLFSGQQSNAHKLLEIETMHHQYGNVCVCVCMFRTKGLDLNLKPKEHAYTLTPAIVTFFARSAWSARTWISYRLKQIGSHCSASERKGRADDGTQRELDGPRFGLHMYIFTSTRSYPINGYPQRWRYLIGADLKIWQHFNNFCLRKMYIFEALLCVLRSITYVKRAWTWPAPLVYGCGYGQRQRPGYGVWCVCPKRLERQITMFSS